MKKKLDLKEIFAELRKQRDSTKSPLKKEVLKHASI
jgi:hypothetical protein